MLGSLLVHWGDVASVSGVVVSLIGLVWAIVVATGARSASQEAHRASIKTSARITGYLQTVKGYLPTYRLDILNKEGETVETTYVFEWDAYESDDDRRNELLASLYTEARRSALESETTLNEIAMDLGIF